jgi:hypothetical protein
MVWCEDTVMETEGRPDTAEINWKPLRWAADRAPQDLRVDLTTVCKELFQPEPESNMWKVALGGGSMQKHLFNMGKSVVYEYMVGHMQRAGGRLAHWATDRQMGKIALLAMNRVSFGTYTSAIEEFTRRTLSRPADGIHAVQGVLGTLTPQFGTFHSGLPEDLFGPSLLWEPRIHSVAHRLAAEDAPFPTWTWARWNLPKGCVWPPLKSSRTCLEHNAYLLTPGGIVELSTAAVTSRVRPPPRNSYDPLSPWAQQRLGTIGQMLLLFCTTVEYYIGDRCTQRQPETRTIKDTVYDYELVDSRGQAVGCIRMPAIDRKSCGKGVQSFISLCRSTGYHGPSISKRYIPTKQVSVDSESSETKTVDMTPDEYPVVDVLLVNWISEVAERVALGHIVSSGFNRYFPKEWVILG